MQNKIRVEFPAIFRNVIDVTALTLWE